MKSLILLVSLVMFSSVAVAAEPKSAPCPKAELDAIVFTVELVDGWDYAAFAQHVTEYARSKQLHLPTDEELGLAFSLVDLDGDGVLLEAAGELSPERVEFSYAPRLRSI